MLVLSRRPQESIVIGPDIVVTVLSVHNDQVRIGISAPRDVDVHRQEVFDAIRTANEEAASHSAADLQRLRGLARAPTRPGPPPTRG